MLQNFGTPITDDTKDAREALRLALGLDKNVPFADYINYINTPTDGYDPAELFSAGQNGFFYELYDISTLYQDALGSMPVTNHNDPIGKVLDKSGNGNHATQDISSKRPIYKTHPAQLYLDKVDDDLVIAVPAGGWIGTMVVATDIGTIPYEVELPAGKYRFGGMYPLSNTIIGIVFRQGSMTGLEKSNIENYFYNRRAKISFINQSDFYRMWYLFKEMVELPFIDTSSGTDFSYVAAYCSSLVKFPLIDTSKGVTFTSSWLSCSSLVEFPLIDTSSGTDFSYAWRFCRKLDNFPSLDFSSGSRFSWSWYGCNALTNFPPNMFDNIKGGDLGDAFASTNLSQQSIDGILTSLVTSGIATGNMIFDQSGGSAPSEIGQAAIDTLRSRGWTVNVTGGY